MEPRRTGRRQVGFIATASEPFFQRGRRDTDELVAFCGLQPSKDKTLLEIGAGAGRMIHRFAELYGRVLALDVSEEMLLLGRGNLAGVGNVEWVLGSGADLDVIPDGWVDDVFSSITLQAPASNLDNVGVRQRGSLSSVDQDTNMYRREARHQTTGPLSASASALQSLAA